MIDDGAFAAVEGGIRVRVRVTPRGGRDAIEGIVVLADGRSVLKARVSAAPEDGKANAALARLLAKLLDVPSARIALTSGATARLKTFHIAGDAAGLMSRLGARLLAIGDRP